MDLADILKEAGKRGEGKKLAQKTVAGKKLTGAEIDALDWLGDEMAKRGISEDEFYTEAE
jgi:hypothetical protein